MSDFKEIRNGSLQVAVSDLKNSEVMLEGEISDSSETVAVKNINLGGKTTYPGMLQESSDALNILDLSLIKKLEVVDSFFKSTRHYKPGSEQLPFIQIKVTFLKDNLVDAPKPANFAVGCALPVDFGEVVDASIGHGLNQGSDSSQDSVQDGAKVPCGRPEEGLSRDGELKQDFVGFYLLPQGLVISGVCRSTGMKKAWPLEKVTVVTIDHAKDAEDQKLQPYTEHFKASDKVIDMSLLPKPENPDLEGSLVRRNNQKSHSIKAEEICRPDQDSKEKVVPDTLASALGDMGSRVFIKAYDQARSWVFKTVAFLGVRTSALV